MKNYDFDFYWCHHFVELVGIKEPKNCIIHDPVSLRLYQITKFSNK